MENKQVHIVYTVWVNLCRFLLAAVFVFSGFVKANDPLGFMYKLADYVEAFGWSGYLSEEVLLLFGVALSAVEFILGVYLLFGINRRFASVSSLLLMSVMTPLTLFLALKNPITDCGCFGDAITLTNWETFGKNLILLAASVSVLLGRRLMPRWITPHGEWLVSWSTLAYILCFAYYCLAYLPVFDFRPYKIGADILEGMEIPEGEEGPVMHTYFMMERDGEQREFAADEYPEDTSWHLVDTRTEIIEKGYEPPIHDFEMLLEGTEEDVTEQVLTDTGYVFLLVAYQLEKADDGYTDLVNELYEYALKYGYPFYGLTSSGRDGIELWRDKTGAEYPFCQMDDITLKTMVRSNPGIILLKNGVVFNKWSSRDLPDEFELSAPLSDIPLGYIHWQGSLRKIVFSVLWFVGSLLLVFVLDRIYHLWVGRRRVRRVASELSSDEKSEKL